MNKLRYQTFLLTRVLQGNGYPSTQALLDAIDAACAIPETEWSARKAAFNAIGALAPLRSGKTTDVCVTHKDIPGLLEREWYEFNTFSQMTQGISRAPVLDQVVAAYWLTDEQMCYPAAVVPEAADVDEESVPRM